MRLIKILIILLIAIFVWSIFVSSGFSTKLLTLTGFKDHPEDSKILDEIQYSFDGIE